MLMERICPTYQMYTKRKKQQSRNSYSGSTKNGRQKNFITKNFKRHGNKNGL
jgi:hypothetical protein